MKYKAKRFGPLPHVVINRTLSMELHAGRVYLSASAHRHIAQDHASDYRVVMDSLEATIAEPTYLGQAPHQENNFEAIKRITVIEQDESGRVLRRFYVLVAICFEPDERGDYRVVSGCTLKQEQVDSRRRSGRLWPPRNE